MQFKNIFLSIFGFLIVSNLSAQKVETRQLRDFENVVSYDGVSVQIVPSDKNYVKVSGEHIDKLITQVSGKTLKIKMNFGSNFRGDGNHVVVYFNGDLNEVKATEGSSISSNEIIKSSSLELRAIEGASIDLNVETDNLSANIASGGIIDAKGKSENLTVSINTGGKFNGKELSSTFAEVKVSAGGNARVKVANVLDASVTMGGNIYYYGNTKTVNESISLGGNIEPKS